MTDLTREATMMQRMTITGWGRCTPEGVVTNDDLATVMDTSDEWIATRSGIRQRRVSHVDNSDLATVAGRQALAGAGLEATDIDYILVATCTPDRFIPAMACHVQAKLGAVNAAATFAIVPLASSSRRPGRSSRYCVWPCGSGSRNRFPGRRTAPGRSAVHLPSS